MAKKRKLRKSQKLPTPSRFHIGHKILLDTRAGDVLGQITESDATHAIMVSDLDATVRYRIPHSAISAGKIQFLS